MILAELREDISKRLQLIDYQLIDNWINDVVQFLNQMYNFQHTQTISDINIDGSEYYALPADCLRVLNIFDKNYDSYTQLPYEVYYRLDDKRGVYTILEDNLYIAGEGNNIKIRYIKKQPVLSLDDDENEMTLYYPEIVKRGVTAKGFKFLEDFQNAAIEEKEFNELIVKTLTKEKENRHRNYRRRYYS